MLRGKKERRKQEVSKCEGKRKKERRKERNKQEINKCRGKENKKGRIKTNR
jgi:hypothetical protein